MLKGIRSVLIPFHLIAFQMDFSVYLNDQSYLVTVKIHDKLRNWMLAPEPHANYLFLSQRLP